VDRLQKLALRLLKSNRKELTVHKSDSDEEKLPPHLDKIHGAVWLIGLALLAWQGWWWPGILVLVAISTLIQGGLSLYVKRNQETTTLAIEREAHLPETCPNCGGPLNAASVRWKGKQSAICPYCGSTVKATVTIAA
jgi:hypothetical protein